MPAITGTDVFAKTDKQNLLLVLDDPSGGLFGMRRGALKRQQQRQAASRPSGFSHPLPRRTP